MTTLSEFPQPGDEFISAEDEASARIMLLVDELRQGYLSDIGGVLQILPEVDISDENILLAEEVAHSRGYPDELMDILIITGQINPLLDQAA